MLRLFRTAPLSLEISQGQLDFSELESISPRSLDSSQLNSLGRSIVGSFPIFLLIYLQLWGVYSAESYAIWIYNSGFLGYQGPLSGHESDGNPSLHSRQNSDISTLHQGYNNKMDSSRRETTNPEIGKDTETLLPASLNPGVTSQSLEQKR